MAFFLSLLIDGALAGAIYALIALAFVLVYKASRMIHFAIGEWVMWGALLVAVGAHTIGLGLGGAIIFSCVGMTALAFVFTRLALHRMTALPVIASIMVTLGLGAVMRGVGAVVFAGLPGGISLPIPTDPILIGGVPIAPDKLVAALVAALCIAFVSAFYRFSRTGLALRAIADDLQTSMSVGIDVDHHLLIVWSIAGVVEDELAGEGIGTLCCRARLGRLGTIDREQWTKNVVHCQERGRHAATGSQELATVEAEPRYNCVGELFYAFFDAALLRRLRQRIELAVRDDLGRHRGMECGVIRGLGPRQLGFAQ